MTNPPADYRAAFMGAIQMDPAALKLFSNLVDMPAAVRLSVNLRIVSTILSKGPVLDILRDGLTKVEKEALLRLETFLEEPELSVAHGLLNVHERWLMVRALSKQFRQALEVDLALAEKPLDPILGKPE